MAIRLVVKSASDLPKLDRFSKIDPYCELTFHEEKQSTSMISNNQSPEWNESFKWTLEVTPETTEVIDVLLLDHETLGKNRAVCNGCIPLAGVLEHGSSSLDVALTNPEGEPLDSKLHVDLSYRAPVSEALKGEVGTLKMRVEELEAQLKTLEVTVAEKEAQVTAMKEQVDPLKAALAEKETELSEAKSEIEQLKTAATAKETELSEAKETIEQLKAENERLKATASERETELSAVRAENEQLKQAAATAPAKTVEVQKEPSSGGAIAAGGDDLRAQNESLTREIASLKRRIEELEEQQRGQPGGGGGQARNRCCGLL